jgi:hypothetical protein
MLSPPSTPVGHLAVYGDSVVENPETDPAWVGLLVFVPIPSLREVFDGAGWAQIGRVSMPMSAEGLPAEAVGEAWRSLRGVERTLGRS